MMPVVAKVAKVDSLSAESLIGLPFLTVASYSLASDFPLSSRLGENGTRWGKRAGFVCLNVRLCMYVRERFLASATRAEKGFICTDHQGVLSPTDLHLCRGAVADVQWGAS